MGVKDIIAKITSGMTLKVPKANLRENGRMPMLIEGFSGMNRQSLLLRWEEVDMLLLDNELYRMHRIVLAKVEKENLMHEGKLIKQGWKSKGWDGENFDYYRLVQ